MLQVPHSLRPIAHLMKVADEYSSRDIVIHYWCLYRAVQEGMKLDKSSPEALNFLMSILSQLEEIKNNNTEIPAIKQEEIAQTHIKNQAQTLFNYAESQEKAGNFNIKVVKAFFTSGYLFDVLNVFKESDENLQSIIKYCKWRATYIHNCLKTGKKCELNNFSNTQTNDESSHFSLNEITEGMKNYNLVEQSDYDNLIPNPNTSSNINSLNNLITSKTFENKNEELKEKNLIENSKFSKPCSNKLLRNNSSNTSLQSITNQMTNKNDSINLQSEDFVEARKFTKYALSALDYDDVKSATENLYKALNILQKQ